MLFKGRIWGNVIKPLFFYLLSILVLSLNGARVINALLPLRVYHPEEFPFRGGDFESRFFRLLRIHRWKDYLPQNNRGFNKGKISSFEDPDYIHRFVLHTCRGETVHFLLGAIGYVFVLYGFLTPDRTQGFKLFLTLSTIYACCQLPFIWVQRYNRPRLIQLEKAVRRKLARQTTARKPGGS